MKILNLATPGGPGAIAPEYAYTGDEMLSGWLGYNYETYRLSTQATAYNNCIDRDSPESSAELALCGVISVGDLNRPGLERYCERVRTSGDEESETP